MTQVATDNQSINDINNANIDTKVRDLTLLSEKQMRSEILRLRSELVIAHTRIAELESVADEDPLMPVLNKRAFERELARTQAASELYNFPASLIYFDLDDFKVINDKYGHNSGDKVLCTVGQILLDNVRKSDIVGRIGGDEFAIIMVHANVEDTLSRAEILENIISGQPVDVDGNKIYVSASVGVAAIKHNSDIKSIIKEADSEMYYNKFK